MPRNALAVRDLQGRAQERDARVTDFMARWMRIAAPAQELGMRHL